MGFKPVRDGHGKVVGVDFRPTTKMLRVALAFNDGDNQKKSNEELLEQCGVTLKEFQSWFNAFVIHEYGKDGEILQTKNHFEVWWDNILQIKSGEERKLLYMIGMERALQGDKFFWEKMSKTTGAITQDEVKHTHTMIPFDLPKEDAGIDEIQSAKRKLLEINRGAVGERGGSGLVRLSAKRSKS